MNMSASVNALRHGIAVAVSAWRRFFLYSSSIRDG